MVVSYRAFFGGGREGGCLFCPERRHELETIVQEDDELFIVKNRRLAGTEHWLIVPKTHIRDIESLTQSDRDMLLLMNNAKDTLLREKCPNIPESEIHIGYHRGHRPLSGISGTFGAPDIISIHHLHLHVIVQPYWYLKYFKYPSWFPGMWVSDKWLLTKLGIEVAAGSEDEVSETLKAANGSVSHVTESS